MRLVSTAVPPHAAVVLSSNQNRLDFTSEWGDCEQSKISTVTLQSLRKVSYDDILLLEEGKANANIPT
jgi:hypothetical protein